MNNTMTRSAYAGAALLLSITAASAAGMLTNKDGTTLYVFDKDKAGDGVGGVWHIIKG